MRKAATHRLAAAFLLIALTATALAELPEDTHSRAEARQAALTSEVRTQADRLIERTLSGAPAAELIQSLRAADSARSPAEQDALHHAYLVRLRGLDPDTAPAAVIDWLAARPAGALVGHAEGPHHSIPLFNIAAQARGLKNQWAWQRGYAAVAGAQADSTWRLAGALTEFEDQHPRSRGMREAIAQLPAHRLDALATACAATSGGCGAARADIELARGHIEWLKAWVATAPAAQVLPRLREARKSQHRETAQSLALAALNHPDPGVAGWAMSDLTAHLAKDAQSRRDWGRRLVDLLDNEALGAAAALQLARLDRGDWLEVAAARTLSPQARRRLALIARAELLLNDERGDARDDQ